MNLIFKPVFRILLNAGVLYLLTKLVTTISFTGDWKFFVIGGIVLGLINVLIKPVMKLLSLPAMFITGGIFMIVINMAVLWFLQYFIAVIKFQDVTLSFPNFTTYAIGAVVFGLINWAAGLII
ncbi:phage holin family protein [Candidatus Peregrinibacteria bacterium]|nr:phage holin family protein [Candidatus Peregrinibacteria bacterium]